MSKIRSKNTRPELTLRSILHKHGYRYRICGSNLPGKPDLVFSSRRKILFVHGCFWHQHTRCIDGHIPKSKVRYWNPKLERNKERDKQHLRKLKRLGWHSLVVWECQLKHPDLIVGKILNFLEG